ncbi:MAG: LysR family transcriptional regulator [Woeseiaceae bacterium]|nr:LysR family transcriptional regulator [Woeseiaceae bacterium]
MSNPVKDKELKRIANLALFARVVQTGGVSACAASLGLERTTVSRRLGALERELGVTLLDRTPKRVTLTGAGKRCFEKCEVMLDAAAGAQRAATVGKSVVNPEPIVVGAPPDLFDSYLDARLSEFEEEHPHVLIERYPVVEMSEHAFDVSDIVVFWESLRNQGAVSSRLSGARQSVYASPEYLAQYGAVNSPFDLDKHRCIIQSPDGGKEVWRFEDGTEQIEKSVKGRYVMSGLLQVREATLAGLGLSRLPDYLCRTHCEAGRLVKVLTEYRCAARDLYLTSRKQMTSKPRATTLRIYLEDSFLTRRL